MFLYKPLLIFLMSMLVLPSFGGLKMAASSSLFLLLEQLLTMALVVKHSVSVEMVVVTVVEVVD